MKTLKVAVAFFLFVAIASCKKDNDKEADCRIITITQTSSSGTTIQNLTYNNDGRILTLSTSGTNGGNKVFTYLGNTVIANATQKCSREIFSNFLPSSNMASAFTRTKTW